MFICPPKLLNRTKNRLFLLILNIREIKKKYKRNKKVICICPASILLIYDISIKKLYYRNNRVF